MILNDSNSIKNILGNTNQAMVYGFAHCHYHDISKELNSKRFGLRIFNYALGNEAEKHETRTTHEKRVMIQIPDRSLTIKSECKCALTNLMFENFKRSNEGLPLIPVLFCLDITNNEYPLSSENVLSKTKVLKDDLLMNDLVTHSELRRIYKLCFDKDIDPRIRKIAQNAFKFVKLERSKTQQDKYTLIKAPAPWSDKQWDQELAKRKPTSKERKKESWRTDLAKLIAKEEGTKTEAEKKESSSKPKSTPKTYCKQKRCVDYSILEQETQDDAKKVRS